jgi:integrase/recombinase XerD
LRLNVKDVNHVEKTLRLHDSHKLSTLILPLDDQCIDAISNWMHERAFVKGSGEAAALFLNTRGSRLGRNSLGKIVNAAGIRLGIHNPDAPKSAIDQRLTPHCYRHFFTTMMRRSNCPERIITYMRGDAPQNIRDIYDHLDFDEVEQHYNAHIWKLRW